MVPAAYWNGQEPTAQKRLAARDVSMQFFQQPKAGAAFQKLGFVFGKKADRCPVFKLGHPPVITVLDGCAMQYVFH